jgi:hypothetical protein
MAAFCDAIHSRQLSTTLLLLLASHRPLTFITGQLLYALAPLGALVGLERIDAWAALLSAPDANARLTTLLSTREPLLGEGGLSRPYHQQP